MRADIAEAARLIRDEAVDRQLILLGESHGTVEPTVLAATLLRADAADRPVRLGLEIWQDTQPALDAYMASAGTPGDRAALMRAEFWNTDGSAHDGRRNHDVVDLIEVARQLRAHGHDVGVFAFDPGPANAGDHHVRSHAMAQAIRAQAESASNHRVLVLAGNVHAMRQRPTYAPPQMQTPMGVDLADLSPFSVRIDARSGAFQACTGPGQCAPMAITAAPGRRSSRGSDGVYDLIVVLDRLTIARLLGTP